MDKEARNAYLRGKEIVDELLVEAAVRKKEYAIRHAKRVRHWSVYNDLQKEHTPLRCHQQGMMLYGYDPR